MSSPPSRPEMPSPESLPSLEELIRIAMSSSLSGPETPSPESFPSVEEFIRSRARMLSLVLPLIMIAAAPPENQQSGENPETQPSIVMMIQMSADSESRFSDLLNKEGPSPASKASIEAMPVVKITEEGTECSICLTEYEVGDEAKEMPCKHRYHSGCIEKWLGIHGSCPVCRYKMPVEKKTGGGEEDGGDSVVEEYIVYISRVGGRGSNSGRASESGDNSSSDTNS